MNEEDIRLEISTIWLPCKVHTTANIAVQLLAVSPHSKKVAGSILTWALMLESGMSLDILGSNLC